MYSTLPSRDRTEPGPSGSEALGLNSSPLIRNPNPFRYAVRMSGFSDAASQMNLNEVAKRAGVSTATVSRVLNHASVVRTPPVCA
jgi:hypothetical protein